MSEEEGSELHHYTVFVRDVVGSPAVPIGEGYGLALSRDKRWALAEKLTEPTREIWLLPVGPGEARRISPANLAPLVAASFLSDGTRVVYMAMEPGHPPRTWLQNVSSSVARPITPEGTAGWKVSPDDKWLLAGRRVGVAEFRDLVLVSVESGNEEEVRGLKPNQRVLGWTSDDQLYVASPSNETRTTYRVERLNPHTGARTAWRDLTVPPIGGVFPDPPIITPDGEAYAFDYRLRLSDTYTVNGAR